MRKIILSVYPDSSEDVFRLTMERYGFFVVRQVDADGALQSLRELRAGVALVVIHSVRTADKVAHYAPLLKKAAPEVPVVLHTGDLALFDAKIDGVDRIYPKLDSWGETFADFKRIAEGGAP